MVIVNRMKRAVVLLSGGLDSATVLAMARALGVSPAEAAAGLSQPNIVAVYDRGEFDGIADITQLPRFCFSELHAARDFAVVDVETGDNAFGQHC